MEARKTRTRERAVIEGGEIVKELNDKQRRFVDEFLIDFNGTEAAKRAGYSAKTAAAQASRLLKNVKIQEHLAKRKAERAERTEVTQDRIVEGLAKIAFLDIRDHVEWGAEERTVETITNKDGEEEPVKEWFNFVRLKEAAEIDGKVINSVKLDKNGQFSVEFANRMQAFEMLARHIGLYDNTPMKDVDMSSYMQAIGAVAANVWGDKSPGAEQGAPESDEKKEQGE